MKNAFLSSKIRPASAGEAAFHVIPVPMESRRPRGRAHLGPQAILDASQRLETCDSDGYGCEADIHTQPPVKVRAKGPEAWIDAVETRVEQALACDATPVVLGGERTVTLGAARAFHSAAAKIGVIHFGAHANLRDQQEGSYFSPACVMRRVHELGFPCIQIATRAVSHEERDYREANPKTITSYDAGEIAEGHMTRHFIPRGFPKHVFISFDVDGLDPAAMPSTRSPVPGGLFWYDVMRMLRPIAATRHIVGFDIVELAPIRVLPHADFTAALLVQTFMGFARSGECDDPHCENKCGHD